MSWEYFLKPEPPGNVFSDAALEEMRAYLRRLSSFQRSYPPNDVVLVSSFELRDRIIREGRVDELLCATVVVRLEPKEIVVSVIGYDERVEQVGKFLEWCQSKWPSQFFDSIDNPLAIDVFIEQLKWAGAERQ